MGLKCSCLKGRYVSLQVEITALRIAALMAQSTMQNSNEHKGQGTEPVIKEAGKTNVIMTVPKGYRCFEPATGNMYYEEELMKRSVVMTPLGKLVFAPTGESLQGALVPLWRTAQSDDKGVALYEGDIVEIDVDSGFGSLTQRIGIMRWSVTHNAFSIHFNGRTSYEGQVTIRKSRKIGNEYQDVEASLRYTKDNK